MSQLRPGLTVHIWGKPQRNAGEDMGLYILVRCLKEAFEDGRGISKNEEWVVKPLAGGEERHWWVHPSNIVEPEPLKPGDKYEPTFERGA